MTLPPVYMDPVQETGRIIITQEYLLPAEITGYGMGVIRRRDVLWVEAHVISLKWGPRTPCRQIKKEVCRSLAGQ